MSSDRRKHQEKLGGFGSAAAFDRRTGAERRKPKIPMCATCGDTYFIRAGIPHANCADTHGVDRRASIPTTAAPADNELVIGFRSGSGTVNLPLAIPDTNIQPLHTAEVLGIERGLSDVAAGRIRPLADIERDLEAEGAREPAPACKHDRLNEDGICRDCGGDMRTGREAAQVEPAPMKEAEQWLRENGWDSITTSVKAVAMFAKYHAAALQSRLAQAEAERERLRTEVLQLSQERSECKAAWEKSRQFSGRLQATLTRYREALRPFAALAQEIVGGESHFPASVSIEDVERAEKLLASDSQPTEGK